MPSDRISSDPAEPELRVALAALDERLRAFGAPIATAFHPGAEPGRVRATLAAAGLVPHDDLVTWWGWHDGAEGGAPPARSGHVFLRAENTLLGPWHVLSLGEALELRQWLREGSGPAGERAFPARRVPVLTTDGGGELCADTEAAGPAPLYLRDEGYFGSEPPHFTSLSELAGCMVRVFDLGQVVADPDDGGAPRVDAGALVGEDRRLAFW